MSSLCCCFNCFFSRQPALSGPTYLHLDPKRRGPKCTVSNFHIAGEGGALGNAAILQDRSYW